MQRSNVGMFDDEDDDDDTLFRAVANWNPRKSRPKSVSNQTVGTADKCASPTALIATTLGSQGFLSVDALRQRFSHSMPSHERLSIAPRQMEILTKRIASPPRPARKREVFGV